MPEVSVAAIILAAGASTRFGSPKQLLDWRGQPLLRHVILQALTTSLSEIVVVLGAHFQRIAPIVHGMPVTLTCNHRWQQGMSSSVALGLRALQTDPDGAIFLLADQPEVSPELIGRMVTAFARTRAPIVVPDVGGRRGNPALFASALFLELMQVRGDQGGRALMQRYGKRMQWVQADERALYDIDWPRDLDQRGV